jgi:hypothetical protein
MAKRKQAGASQIFFDFDTIAKHTRGIAAASAPAPGKPVVFPETPEYRPYGSWVSFSRRLSQPAREAANAEVIALLKKESLSPEETDRLRRYSGFGGLSVSGEHGVLYDYYTSPPLADMTWRLLNKASPLRTGESVLEPSCGTGVFFDTAPAGLELHGVELDERTAACARRLHPGAAIYLGSYELFNLRDPAERRFDRVIGNAPFGQRPVQTSRLDLPDEKSLDRYFVSRSLDNLKPGGAMALIVHPGVLGNESSRDWRTEISRKARFLGAVKLSNSSFSHTHTSIQPDILLFQKLPEEMERRLTFAEPDFLHDLSPSWIEGDYFKHHPENIMGAVEEGAGQWGSDLVRGEVTPEAITNALDAFTPLPPLSGQQILAVMGIDAETLGKETARSKNLSEEEAKNYAGKTLLPGNLSRDGEKRYMLTLDEHRSPRWNLVSDNALLSDKLDAAQALSSLVSGIRGAMRERSGDIGERQKNAVDGLENYKKEYGFYPKDDPDINRFLKKYPAVRGVYEALAVPEDDILAKENLYDNSGRLVDGHNQAVKALLFLRERMIEPTEENIRRHFPGTASNGMDAFFSNPDIFLDAGNAWRLREDFVSGSAWDKIDVLEKRLQTETDEKTKTAFRRGADELRKAAGWVSIEDADFSPHSSWIPEHIINAWVQDSDGIASEIDATLMEWKLAKNPQGKWGVIPPELKINSRYDFNTHQYVEVERFEAGHWYPHNHALLYYLNMQKQRSRNVDTDVYNREHNDLFKAYIANHPEFRDTLEQKFNRLFNTEIGAPVKTYPVYLEGWKTERKTLKPHQWQSIHHLYRQGKGISALGTGFGKTLAAAGLQTLLQQEHNIRRAWIQVPNNKVKDWVAEIREVLPGKNIGFVDPETPGYSSREKRYAKYQRLCNSDCDIIILPESSAGEIQLTPEHDDDITEREVSKHLAEKGEGQTERRREIIRDSAERRLQNGKTNLTVSFEDFGCDAVFVDEAHRYKNLFTSSLSRETGMNDGRQSAKAMSLFKKCAYIREQHGGKNIFLFTATPLTNSPLEYFNMLQYVAPEELERFGIATIDGFIKNFADIKTGLKYYWGNGQTKEGPILEGFKNLQTLQAVFFKYTDYQNDPVKINLEKPSASNKPNVIPKNAEQTGVLKTISERLEQYAATPQEDRAELFPGENFLTFYSQMRTASLDLELFDPKTYKDWKNPKLETLAKNARENFLAKKGGQVVFCDRVFSSDGSFNIHDKIRQYFVDTGFKSGDIVIVNGFTKSGGVKSDSQVEKEVSKAVEDYNSGFYKVIIGSTACIGEGLNLQKNSSALHHFDIPFRPSDFIQRNGRIDRQGNSQDNVELHTYMSAGTIDNYSVQLVQNKAGWIDKLLKTKSNVFLNPNDESYVDSDELLMALTEEWGDKAKAAEMRLALRNKKEAALLEAQNKKRADQTASLALMRCSLKSFSGDKGSSQYQTRLNKIAMLEKALLNNPTFKDKSIIGNSTPFLYSKTDDRVIRAGDCFKNPYDSYFMRIEDINFKKQHLYYRPLRPNTSPFRRDDNRLFESSLGSFSPEPNSFVSRPDKETTELLGCINTAEFYELENSALKETFYGTHYELAAKSAREVYYAFPAENGGLKLTNYLEHDEHWDTVFPLNPYSKEGREQIKAASERGLECGEEDKKDILAFYKKNFPDIGARIETAIAKQDFPIPQSDNTPAKFRDNIVFLAGMDACGGNPVEAARMLIRAATPENKDGIKRYLLNAGATDPASTRRLIASLVPPKHFPRKHKQEHELELA